MTLKQKRALETLWPLYGLDIENGVLNYDAVFGRHAPVNIEIGFGMGTSLLTMAKENPDQDFIGIEVHRPGVGSLMASIEEESIKNIRIYSADVREVFEHGIPENSVSKILILFPDPWPKNRHHKRRLVQSTFLEQLSKKLLAGGIVHMATDWQEYAEQMVAALESVNDLKNIAGEGAYFEGKKPRPHTKFELRGKNLGHGI
jgi:tRNA (guanine-N7-)-methyltransferase